MEINKPTLIAIAYILKVLIKSVSQCHGVKVTRCDEGVYIDIENASLYLGDDDIVEILEIIRQVLGERDFLECKKTLGI